MCKAQGHSFEAPVLGGLVLEPRCTMNNDAMTPWNSCVKRPRRSGRFVRSFVAGRSKKRRARILKNRRRLRKDMFRVVAKLNSCIAFHTAQLGVWLNSQDSLHCRPAFWHRIQRHNDRIVAAAVVTENLMLSMQRRQWNQLRIEIMVAESEFMNVEFVSNARLPQLRYDPWTGAPTR